MKQSRQKKRNIWCSSWKKA